MKQNPHIKALPRAFSRLTKEQRLTLIAEAKREIPELLAAITVHHLRLLDFGDLASAATVENQIALALKITQDNAAKHK